MKILKEGQSKSPQDSLKFFSEHIEELGKINYVVLYYGENEWQLNPHLYRHYVIIIGEEAHIWISGLTWGYYGTGPGALHDLLQMIDPTILYEQINDLEWMAEDPIMFENFSGKLVLSSFNQEVYSLLCENDTRLPRGIVYIRKKRLITPENLF